jgi:hypothetical protein
MNIEYNIFSIPGLVSDILNITSYILVHPGASWCMLHGPKYQISNTFAREAQTTAYYLPVVLHPGAYIGVLVHPGACSIVQNIKYLRARGSNDGLLPSSGSASWCIYWCPAACPLALLKLQVDL